ncbi:hypothetical protein HD596_010183 [Nonomuraea jabiensis]|uniref:Resolvase/invertase-type recombinase catalytic domain-containing protein n=1 Tax=Nonomuraea jabiensis TaxID=882448 RepID=A0A7W9GGM9_9ACTN|nr:hypothetical protein [Nonomuraea jabiensis]
MVHEHKRLGRGLDLAALAEQLKAAGIGLDEKGPLALSPHQNLAGFC